MARPAGSTFDPILAYLKERARRGVQLGLRRGQDARRSTPGTRGRSPTPPSRRSGSTTSSAPDGTPYDTAEVAFIRKVTGGSPRASDRHPGHEPRHPPAEPPRTSPSWAGSWPPASTPLPDADFAAPEVLDAGSTSVAVGSDVSRRAGPAAELRRAGRGGPDRRPLGHLPDVRSRGRALGGHRRAGGGRSTSSTGWARPSTGPSG